MNLTGQHTDKEIAEWQNKQQLDLPLQNATAPLASTIDSTQNYAKQDEPTELDSTQQT